MIDWKRVIALHDEVGDGEFLALVELFLDEIEGGIMTIDARDPEMTAQLLHFLAGCAANLGLRAFGRLCETPPAAIAPAMDRVDLPQLRGCYAASKQMLLRDLRRMTRGGDAVVA